MESLAIGRPVIATNVAGVAELVEPGVSGWLVPPGAVEPLATSMQQALEMPLEELMKMGEQGAARVTKQHDVRTEAAILADLFVADSTTPTSGPR